MGQYHAICSLDAGEAISASAVGEGVKLLEQGLGGHGGSTTALALAIAPQGRWHGNRIAVIGDYASPGDLPSDLPYAQNPGELYGRQYEGDGYSRATLDLRDEMAQRFGINYVGDSWTHRTYTSWRRLIVPLLDQGDDLCHGPLYVVNNETLEFLDPLAFGTGRNLDAIALTPQASMMGLMVLLAVSNGRGGGDFHLAGTEPDAKLVGSWGGCSVTLGPRPPKGIDISTRLIELIDAVEGEWLGPDWHELGQVPWDMLQSAARAGESLAGLPGHLAISDREAEILAALLQDGADPARSLDAARKLVCIEDLSHCS